MKHSWLKRLLVILIILSSFNISSALSQKNIYRVLDFDRRLILRIGDQRAAGPCTVYSLAYSRAILDYHDKVDEFLNKTDDEIMNFLFTFSDRKYTEKATDGHGKTVDIVAGGWVPSAAKHLSYHSSNLQTVLRLAYDKISSGRPVTMWVDGVYGTMEDKEQYRRADVHMVLLIGYKITADPDYLSPTDFYAADPCCNFYTTGTGNRPWINLTENAPEYYQGSYYISYPTDDVTCPLTYAYGDTATWLKDYNGNGYESQTAEMDPIYPNYYQHEDEKGVHHQWLYKEMVWSDDYRARGLFVCPMCQEIMYVDAEVTVTEEDGYYVYKATVSYEGENAVSVRRVRIRKPEVTRISGDSYYETALLVADQIRTLKGTDKFADLIVATGEKYPDALSGGYLAAMLKAPVLLVDGQHEQTVREYILSNLAEDGTVYILGGEEAISAEFESSISGFNVHRVSGNTRYQTSIAILEAAGYRDELIVATGRDFADCLTAGATGKPVLLVDGLGSSLKSSQKAFLENYQGTLTIVGGYEAVNEKIESALRKYATVNRIGGEHRYETAVMIAEQYFDQPELAVLAYSHEFPDALIATPLAAMLKAPLLISKGTTGINDPMDYIWNNNIDKGYVVGSSDLIDDEAVRKIYSMTADDQITVITGN